MAMTHWQTILVAPAPAGLGTWGPAVTAVAVHYIRGRRPESGGEWFQPTAACCTRSLGTRLRLKSRVHRNFSISFAFGDSFCGRGKVIAYRGYTARIGMVTPECRGGSRRYLHSILGTEEKEKLTRTGELILLFNLFIAMNGKSSRHESSCLCR